MFGRNHKGFDFGEVGVMAMFTIAANMARKLNIPAEEFMKMMNDVDGAHKYLHDIIEKE